MSRISIPTKARLPSSLRIDPSNATVIRTLNRLSRPSLLSLVLDWLDEANQSLAAPYLRPPNLDDEDDDPDDFYPPAESMEELRELYTDLQSRKGSKREVLDRVLEGDWRRGVSLYQLAMADLQYLYDHPGSQKWAAYRVCPLKKPGTTAGEEPLRIDKESLAVPRFHPSTFLEKLQASLAPDVKAHFNFDRHKTLPLLLLRIFIVDSPYNTALAVPSSSSSSSSSGATTTTLDGARTLFVAFPDASPHVYISRAAAPAAAAAGLAGAGEGRSLLALLVEGIPAALSRARARVALRATSFSSRSLPALLERRGGGRGAAAGGGWGVYAAEGGGGGVAGKRESPLDTVLPSPPLSPEEEDADGVGGGDAGGKKRVRDAEAERTERVAKRRRLVAKARFGASGMVGDGMGVERVDIRMEDAFPAQDAGGLQRLEEEEDGAVGARPKGGRRSGIDVAFDREAEAREDNGENGSPDVDGEEWRPGVKLTFHGPHVFAGLRQLVEAGIVDGEKMPGWMTGEEGVTIGAVRHGRIRGFKGSGM